VLAAASAGAGKPPVTDAMDTAAAALAVFPTNARLSSAPFSAIIRLVHEEEVVLKDEGTNALVAAVARSNTVEENKIFIVLKKTSLFFYCIK